MALTAIQRCDGRWISFEAAEPRLRSLLSEFGPGNSSPRPEYPFWRLQNDGLWEIPEAPRLASKVNSSGDVSAAVLRAADARGGLPEPYHSYLRADPEFVNELVAEVLERSFPSSLHETILDEVGFPWVILSRRRRDPRFRDDILRIYERRCAVCGYDGRLGATNFGLDAAHVKWHAAGGPDSLDNGIAMCSYHHVALDRGALTIEPDLRIRISQHVIGSHRLDSLLFDFIGCSIRRPQTGTPTPKSEYLDWHRTEVFREPARLAS
jgi:putative restriction endonuclease